MNTSGLYSKLEMEFELIHDNYEYMKMFQTEDAEIAQIARFENVLLEGDVSFWVDKWSEETKRAVGDYCEKRFSETKNNHLKAKYGWALWAIGGKLDYRLLAQTTEIIIQILESYLKADDYEHASTFCHYYKRIYYHCCKMGQEEKVVALIDKALASDNQTLKFHVMSMVYYQEQEDEWIREKREGYEKKEQLHFLKKMDSHLLGKVCLEMAERESEDRKYESLLEWAVFFADNTNDMKMKKEAYEKQGDYKMSHLFPEQEGNIAPPLQNDILLRQAMNCYKVAGNPEKLMKATLAYEANLPKKRFLRYEHTISVEERNQQVELMNNYIIQTADKGTLSIISHLLGNGIDVFLPSKAVRSKTKEEGRKYFYQTLLGAAIEDSFHNTRQTTHEKVMTFQYADIFYKNHSFDIFTCVICSGLKAGTLSADILKSALLELGFDIEANKTDADGMLVGSSYWERVEIGMTDFLRLIQDYSEKKEVDWRYCLIFLSTQFEGLFRDVITKLGGTTTRTRRDSDTELIPLEGLLNSDCLSKVFNEDDLFLFRMTFTKDGYNIRNDIAHGMLLPQEYNVTRAMLVFVSIIRLTKATSYISDMINGFVERTRR